MCLHFQDSSIARVATPVETDEGSEGELRTEKLASSNRADIETDSNITDHGRNITDHFFTQFDVGFCSRGWYGLEYKTEKFLPLKVVN